jgi:hypothetical protein
LYIGSPRSCNGRQRRRVERYLMHVNNSLVV